jgi:outer membrane protein assembly factor BamB
MMRRLHFISLAFLAVSTISLSSVSVDHTWPQFRGPAGRGIADLDGLPIRWSATQNVQWKITVPGRGWSSPIVWGNQLIVTSAISAGTFRTPLPGFFGNDGQEFVADTQAFSAEERFEYLKARDIESSDEAGEVRYLLYSYDVRTGKMRWAQQAHTGKPFVGRHRKNTYASETPATDGERIYALFGNVGLFCYSMDGTLLWTYRIEPHARYADAGTAASPVVYNGRVYVLDDSETYASLTALDAKTGRVIWKKERAFGSPRTGWSTPLVWTNAKRTEIITLGRSMAVSYDLDGGELWRLKGLTMSIPIPIDADGLLYLGSGTSGEGRRPLFAVKPGASGDISLANDNQASNEFIAWYEPRMSAYMSSPLVYRGRIYAVHYNGVLAVHDAKTGGRIYQARVGGVANSFSASPWSYGGKVFFLSEDGDTFVLNPGDRYDEIAMNTLGEITLATPAVTRDGLFIRTATHLFRIR